MPALVRGLDYYRHTAFEFVTDRLGAQGTVLGGGRYDGLIEALGGPHTPAVGWAAGIERLAMLVEEPAAPALDVAWSPERATTRRRAGSQPACAGQDFATEAFTRGNLQEADGAGFGLRRALRGHCRGCRRRRR